MTRKNDYVVDYALRKPNDGTGVPEAATGLTLQVWVSLTDGGTAVHADLTKTLSARAQKPGTYYAVFDGDQLDSRIPAGTTAVYLVMGDSANVLVSDPVAFRDVRRSA